MVEANGSQPVNGGQPNGAGLPTSLDDFLSEDEWRDLRAGQRDLAQVRARSEAAAAHIRI